MQSFCRSWILLALFTPALSAQDGSTPEPVPVADDSAESRELRLDLAQALELALANNLGLRLAELDSEVASYDHLGSWGDFEWNFNAQGTFTDSEREVSSSFISGGSTIESENRRMALDLSKPLTTGGNLSINFDTDRQSTNSLIANSEVLTSDSLVVTYTQPLRRRAWNEYATSTQREAELGWRRLVETQRQNRQQLNYSVRTAYWDLVAAVELQQVAVSAQSLAEELLTKRRRELAAGVGTEVEVLESRAEVATRVEALLQATNMVGERMDGLKRLLYGAGDASLWDVDLVPTTPLPQSATQIIPTWTEALMTAVELRSELRQLRVAVDIARLTHQRSLSDRLAGVDLAMTASSGAVNEEAGDALNDTLEWNFPTFTVQLTYDMPIGNKRADYAERSAQARVRRSLLEYDTQELDIVADVRKAVRDVDFRTEAVRAATESLVLSERQLEAEQARNEQGLSTNYQVLEVQQRYVEALSGEREARAEWAKAGVELERAQGLLGETGGNL
ncbi:MAG: outer membrane protein [Planctomycetota bacterium]|jgi:outer membrane protein